MGDRAESKLKLAVLACRLSVCRYAELPPVPPAGAFVSVTQTADEVSLVCETESVPAGAVAREDGWRAFKVAGPLDFGLVGILAKIASALADAAVPLFAVSTYDTDYVLVKGESLDAAIRALREVGCEVAD